jgi:hypothetical protein
MLKWNLILCLPTNSMWLIFRAEKVTQYVFAGLNILHGLHEFSVVYIQYAAIDEHATMLVQ